jgi:hypothetical protein
MVARNACARSAAAEDSQEYLDKERENLPGTGSACPQFRTFNKFTITNNYNIQKTADTRRVPHRRVPFTAEYGSFSLCWPVHRCWQNAFTIEKGAK